MATETVTVDLLNKEFTFRCPEEQVAKLRKAAASLNEEMLGILSNGQNQGFERVAVTAAINICAKSFENQTKNIKRQQLAQRLEKLERRIAAVLSTQQQLELELN